MQLESFDDLVLTTIAQSLANMRAMHSLASLACTNKRLRNICQPLIAGYDAQCEARFEDREEGITVWTDEDGKPHRYHDRPAIVDYRDQSEWFFHGKRHREGNDPAVINDLGCEWWRDGVKYREWTDPQILAGLQLSSSAEDA